MSKNSENIKVVVSDGFPADKAIKKFKRMCDTYGIIKQYRAREAYQKPSVKAKEKREAAEKRRKKTNSKNSRFRQKI